MKKGKKIIVVLIIFGIIFAIIPYIMISEQKAVQKENDQKRGDVKTSQISELWSYTTGEGGVYSSPALGDVDGDGKLEAIVGSYDKNLYALNGEDGTLLWSYKTGSHVQASPTLGDVDNDGKLEVVIGSWDENVYALNGEDGSVVWIYKTEGPIFSCDAVLGDIDNDYKLEVIVGSCDKKVHALNGEDGSLLWSFKAEDIFYGSSAALGDVDNDGKLEVIVGSYDKKIYALNGEDGSILWNYMTGRSVHSSPALGDLDGDDKLEVIVGSDDKKIYALNGEDGSDIWSFTTEEGVHQSSPALGDIDNDGKLEAVVGSTDGRFHALNGEDGSIAWSYKTARFALSSPALGDVDGDGKLEAVVGTWYEEQVRALNGEDGSETWRYNPGTGPIYSSAALGDIDSDGQLEVVIGSTGKAGVLGKVYALDPLPSGEEICWQGLSGDSFFFRNKIKPIDPVLQILNEISEKISQLDGLINNNLESWRKYICRKLICVSQYLIDKMIEKHVNFEQIRCYYLDALQLNIYLIKKIAKDEEISNICSEIFILSDEVKELI